MRDIDLFEDRFALGPARGGGEERGEQKNNVANDMKRRFFENGGGD